MNEGRKTQSEVRRGVMATIGEGTTAQVPVDGSADMMGS